MPPKDLLRKSINDNGAIVYDLNLLLEEMDFYSAIKVACADLLDVPDQMIPMDAGEYGNAATRILSDEMPDRFNNQFIGLEYMGKYCLKIHSDGIMVVTDL